MNKVKALSLLPQMKSLSKSVGVGFQTNSVRTAFVYTPDWLPAPRPQNEEDRIKAAKKYNLLPEEYEAQPDDGFAPGDYPHLPTNHFDEKDPFYPWDYPMLRINYGETLPDDFAITTHCFYNEDMLINKKFAPWKQLAILSALFTAFSTIVYFFMVKYKYHYPKFDTPLYNKEVKRFGYAPK